MEAGGPHAERRRERKAAEQQGEGPALENQAPLVLIVRRWPILAYLRGVTAPVLSTRVGPHLGACLRLQGPLEARKPEHLFELPGTRCKEPVHA